MPWTRRKIITVTGTGIVAGLLPGCSSEQSQEQRIPPDIVVFNDTSSETTASVTVASNGGEDTLISETVTITARQAAEYPDVLSSTGTFTLSIDVRDGPTASATRRVTTDAESFQAIIGTASIQFRIRSPTSE